MSRVLAIAQNTFREAIRDRVLYSLLFFAALLLLTSLAMREITIGDQDEVVRSVACGAIRLFGSTIAIFLGIGLVYKEIERKTIYTIASKPLPRWLFLLGKYAGLMAVIASELALMGAFYSVLVTLQQGFPAPSFFVALGMLYLELALLTAWAMLFSTMSAPTTAAAFSLAVFVIGHLADDIQLFGNRASSQAVRDLAQAIYVVLPNLSVFNGWDLAVHGMSISREQVVGAAIYGPAYTVVVLAVAIAVFSRRDFR